jgi:hypothetical protein
LTLNEKRQVTKERLYSEERKEGRIVRVTKDMAGEQKSMEE